MSEQPQFDGRRYLVCHHGRSGNTEAIFDVFARSEEEAKKIASEARPHTGEIHVSSLSKLLSIHATGPFIYQTIP